jgi:ubiquinone/menaquinone biosynthesis C-methylase UbiE
MGDVIYQHPLAYLLGLQGHALLRAFSGEYGREFTRARLAEIQELLDSAEQLGEGCSATPVTSAEGYESWAPHYDEPGNAMVDREGPIVRAILDRLWDGTPRVALDAACGTGRHAAHLVSLGHTVIGVDNSPAMLALARAKVPGVRWHEGELDRLPLPDDHVDIVVCGLALTHLPDLRPVLAEFVRVLRPGGHLVISDVRGIVPGGKRYPVIVTRSDGSIGYIPCWTHSTSDYLRAALPLGLRARLCEEPARPSPLVDRTGTPPGDGEPAVRYVAGDGVPGVWSLHPWASEATNATFKERPHFIVWHFELSG